MRFKTKEAKGITLIALVITIIVLLILAGVTIATLTGDNGILTQANDAKTNTNNSKIKEQIQLEAVASLGTDGKLDKERLIKKLNNIKGIEGVPDNTDYTFPLKVTLNNYQVYLTEDGNVSEPFNAEEWDKKASDEDCFYWKNDIPGEDGYNIIIGYKEKISNYSIVNIPSRCHEIYAYELSEANSGRDWARWSEKD